MRHWIHFSDSHTLCQLLRKDWFSDEQAQQHRSDSEIRGVFGGGPTIILSYVWIMYGDGSVPSSAGPFWGGRSRSNDNLLTAAAVDSCTPLICVRQDSVTAVVCGAFQGCCLCPVSSSGIGLKYLSPLSLLSGKAKDCRRVRVEKESDKVWVYQ